MWNAIASIVGAGISAAASLAGIHSRNEAQKRESELAYKREQAQIKEQNAYNSASAQMARLQAAGLNPNLMYENSQEAAAGTQTDIAHYQPAEMQSAFEPMGNAGQQMINSMIGLKDMENKTLLAESQILVNESTAGVNWQQVNLSQAQENQIYELLGLQKSEIDARVKEINSRTGVNNSQIKVNEESAKALIQQVLESKELIKKYQAEVGYISSQEACMLALLPSQIQLNEMSAIERANAALKAYEEYRTIAAYYYLDLDKFEFERFKVENQNEQNKLDRKVQYWRMGLDTGIQVLGMGVSLATKGAGSLGGYYGMNPWNRASSSTFGQPMNSPTGSAPTPWYNKQHGASKRYGR